MKTRKMKIACALLFFLPAGVSCSDKESDEASGQGSVEIMANWDDYSSEAELPTTYTLAIGGFGVQVLDSRTAVFQTLLDAGTHELIAYNTPANMTVDNPIARVTLHENGTLRQPGYLFSNSRIKSILVEPDKTVSISLKMKQRVRKLTLTLVPRGGDPAQIEETEWEASLSGIASAFNLLTEEWSDPKSIDLIFRKQPSGAYSATCCLLGVVAGEKQELALSLNLSKGRHYTLKGDLSETLRYAGNDIAPLSLQSPLDLPEGIEASGNILPWQPEFEEGPQDVELH